MRRLAILLLLVSPALRAGDEPTPRVIEVTAKRFEFEPKEIHVAKGETVIIRLTSADVPHGFFSRKLKIDADVPPGKTTDVTLTAAEPGAYSVICNHFCGSGHGGMKATIVVE
jgi:cytochrome c oxidase subunit II